MKVPGNDIAEVLQQQLKNEVKLLFAKGIPVKLTTILVGESAEQVSFVNSKRKIAEKLGITFEFDHLNRAPSYEKLMQSIKKHSMDKETTGIVIQQPLPPHLQTNSIYNCIHVMKEIEGHKNKSPFLPPIGLAVLTVLKYIYFGQNPETSVMHNPMEDIIPLKKELKHKKIVIVGRGITGGAPIGKTFSTMKINFISVNSKTIESSQYYKQANIIITATGKKIIQPEHLKENVVLLNVGLRKEGNLLRGDYEEKEISSVASYYSPTPGGIGPIDVLYLYKNLIDACKLQNKIVT